MNQKHSLLKAVVEHVKQQREGFILVMSVLFLALMSSLVTRMYLRSTAYDAFGSVIEHQERAILLAESARYHLLAQLNATLIGFELQQATKDGQPQEAQPKEEEKKEKEQKVATADGAVVQSLLPGLNHWTDLPNPTPPEERRPTELIRVYLAAEDGKIDFNALFPVPKKKKEGEPAASAEPSVAEQPKQAEKESEQEKKQPSYIVLAKLSKYLQGDQSVAHIASWAKEKPLLLNDVTELLLRSEFSYFLKYVFMQAPAAQESEKRANYLTDIFTIWTGRKGLNPWLLSAGILELFDLKVPDISEPKKIQQMMQKYKKNFNASADWDAVFKDLYGIEWAKIKDSLGLLLAKDLTMPTISAVIEIVVDDYRMRAFAIFEYTGARYELKKWYLI